MAFAVDFALAALSASYRRRDASAAKAAIFFLARISDSAAVSRRGASTDAGGGGGFIVGAFFASCSILGLNMQAGSDPKDERDWQKMPAELQSLPASNYKIKSMASSSALVYFIELHSDNVLKLPAGNYVLRAIDDECDEGSLRQMQKEYRLMAAHQYLSCMPKVYAIVRLDDGVYAILMQQIIGKGIDCHVESHPDDTDIPNRLLDALVELSGAGTVHGDLHGGNIMIETGTGRVYFIDFEYSYVPMQMRQMGVVWTINDSPSGLMILLKNASGAIVPHLHCPRFDWGLIKSLRYAHHNIKIKINHMYVKEDPDAIRVHLQSNNLIKA